jgi:hypothetical protein
LLLVRWNLTSGLIEKPHHNWNKIFGNQKISISDVKPILEQAVAKANGKWETVRTIHGPGGKVIGDKVQINQEVNGHKIWVAGMRDHSTNEIIINGGGVD